MVALMPLLRSCPGGDKASEDLGIDRCDSLDILPCLWALCFEFRNDLLDQAPQLRLSFIHWSTACRHRVAGPSLRQLSPQSSEDMENLTSPSRKAPRWAHRLRQLQKSGEIGFKVREDCRGRSEL